MTEILLIRHGHVEGIEPGRFRGRHNIPLSEQGLAQAQAVARRIAARWHPAIVYTSPLQRCPHTAREIAARCGAGIETLDAMTDLDYGQWQWRTHEEVQAHWPQHFDLWLRAPHRMRFPQGESLQDLAVRMADGLRLIAQRHANETAMVVGHDSGNRVLLLQLLELPLSAYWRLAQEPCGLSEIDISAHGARILRLNETQHLRDGPP